MKACLICGADVSRGMQSSASGICGQCIGVMACWRCGEPVNGYWPYLVCGPCVNVVSPAEIEWLNDPDNQPGKRSWEMAPLGMEQGR